MDAAASVDQRARDVVEYLIVAWRRVFRLMTAGQAMAALGLAPDPQVRARVADRLAAAPERSPIIRRWGVPALVLTGEEKLLGRALERTGQSCTAEALARQTGVAVPVVRERLALLIHCGLVADNAGGYRLADGWARCLGPLSWTFHEVRPEGEPAYWRVRPDLMRLRQPANSCSAWLLPIRSSLTRHYNVPCAVDFLLLARHAYPDRRLTIADTCAGATRRSARRSPPVP